MKLALAVVGSRDFSNYLLLKEEIEKLPEFSLITEIISGGAKGADTLGALYARDSQLQLTEYIPMWSKYGKSAGFKRNTLIIQNADIVIAFWDGTSKGTLSSIELAKKYNKKLHIIRY